MTRTTIAHPKLCFATPFFLSLLILPACAPEQGDSQSATAPGSEGSLSIEVLSSRPDMVTGGDALVAVSAEGVPLDDIVIQADGRDVTGAFSPIEAGRLEGLVSGLTEGENGLVASNSGGSAQASITLTNHPITGPVVSGPHFTPIVCRTEESELGAPLDENCSARTSISYYYRSTTPDAGFVPLPDPDGPLPEDVAQTTITTGATVPYIVRVEAGTINRAIYRIAMLDNPADNTADWQPDAGWNRRLLFSFGGGCGTNYNQGTRTDSSVLDDTVLSRGLAHALSSFNVMGHRCNDALSAETLMMIKEHFTESYGRPLWTVGLGGSGGAIQQLLITQNYPGLLDGLLPSLSFADSFSLRPGVADCRLLIRYFESSDLEWTDEKRQAVEGYTNGTCAAWNRGLVNVIVADVGCGIPEDMVYDAVRNPQGARCTIYDTNIASVGADPSSGYGLQALDNEGLQYGLLALNNGAISKEEFLDLNEGVGGYDRDGYPHGSRTLAQLEGVRNIYRTGRVNQGQGGLGSVPIIQYRRYLDQRGDIHDRFRDFQIRARIDKAHGRHDNQAIWVYSTETEGLNNQVTNLAIDTMSEWLDALAADQSDEPAIERIVHNKPAQAVDGCWDLDGNRIDEVASFDGDGRCNALYPNHMNPRLAAGANLADDAVKCALKEVNPADYAVEFTDQELARLRAIFPSGVCDYSRPGVNQVDISGTFLTLPLN